MNNAIRNQSAFARLTLLLAAALAASLMHANGPANGKDGKHLFEQETFGGNGRTCRSCHRLATGTVSPQDAQKRFGANRWDPLFLHDGSDDGRGNGVTRMLKDATILVEVPLPPNAVLADDP